MEKNTAKHFVLQLGSLLSLYISLVSLLVLLFGIINILFFDEIEGVWMIESAGSNIRIGIAMLVVFFPTFLILTRTVNQIRRQEDADNQVLFVKWLVYLSLLIGGVALLGNLVTVIIKFLDGEITQRFILKSLSFLVVIGSAFFYYLQDTRGYWLKNEKKSIRFGVVFSSIVLISIVFGFVNIETPAEVRDRKTDEMQISHLQDMEWRIQDYLTQNDQLPETLEDIYVNVPVPTAPNNRPAYVYNLTEEGFELCATFVTESRVNYDRYYGYELPIAKPTRVDESGEVTEGEKTKLQIYNLNNWEHRTGEVCFERDVR